jgi:hypothetical protein
MAAQEWRDEAGDHPGEFIEREPSALDHYLGRREEPVRLVRDERAEHEELYREPRDR